MLTVLQVHNYHFVSGGADRFFFDTMLLLKNKGHTVIPFSMKNIKNYKSDFEIFFVNAIDYSNLKPSFKNFLTAIKMIYSFEARFKLAKLIRKVKPDIAHLHNIYGRITPSIIFELKKHNIPIVMTLHDYKIVCPSYRMTYNNKPCELCKGGKYYRSLVRRCVKNSAIATFVYMFENYLYTFLNTYNKHIDYFIAPSRFIQSKMTEHGISQKKIVYIPNFIDASNIEPYFNHDGYILYSGKLLKDKGLITLLNAIKLLNNCVLYVAGEGDFKSVLEIFIEKNNLSNVRFLGHLNKPSLTKVIRDAMFVVLPSECYENAPLAVLESFAYGKPVIGSNIGGIPEMVIDGETGLLFGPGNENDLREKIAYFLNNPKKVAEMGKNARRKVEEEYNAELHYKSLMEIYYKILYKI